MLIGGPKTHTKKKEKQTSTCGGGTGEAFRGGDGDVSKSQSKEVFALVVMTGLSTGAGQKLFQEDHTSCHEVNK